MTDLLARQREYYRERAAEYDEWFTRQGRYDRGPAFNTSWFQEAEQVRRHLVDFAPRGRVLELACGTGLWTRHLAPMADALTCVDAAPQMVEVNKARVADGGVRYELADIFEWTPDGQYDVVFFGFWLSHVPCVRFDAFWSLVERALAPGGRFFFVDSLFNANSTAADHQLNGPDAERVTRKLNDGRAFDIVKVFYRPERLADRLAALGWDARITSTDNFFLLGSGARRS